MKKIFFLSTIILTLIISSCSEQDEIIIDNQSTNIDTIEFEKNLELPKIKQVSTQNASKNQTDSYDGQSDNTDDDCDTNGDGVCDTDDIDKDDNNDGTPVKNNDKLNNVHQEGDNETQDWGNGLGNDSDSKLEL